MPATQTDFIQALYDNYPDPVILADTGSIILSANAAALKQFGYAASEIVGGPVSVLYASDADFARALRQSSQKSEDDDVSEAIHRYRRRDETVFTARLRITPVVEADGTKKGFAGIVHGISDHPDPDGERRKAGEILDTALQAIPEGFAIFDKDERLIAFNDAYRRLCGQAGPKIKAGMSAKDIMSTVDEATGRYPLVPLDTAQAKLRTQNHRDDLRTPNGDDRVFQYGEDRWFRVADMKTPDGNTVVLRIDVTDLKQTELDLDRQRLEYYRLVQNIPDFIIRVSKERNITFVNDRYAKFVGLPHADLIGRPYMDFVPERERGAVELLLENLSPEAPTMPREERRQLADGRDFYIFWSHMAVFDDRMPAEYVLAGRDITDLRRQEVRIDQKSGELQRKNDALNLFIATVSHDLKAPLRHMSMFSEMIGDDVANGNLEELRVYASHLRQSARQMDRLIDGLVDYAQIADRVGNWQTVDMADVISDAILVLGPVIAKTGARFEFDSLPQVKGDPELLNRLCQCLIGNAIKYRREEEAPIVRIYGEKGEGSALIYFQDNGIGIDPRFSRKIFDVFQRLHRDESIYPGTGIGLTLAKRIAESHNGSIELDTTFTQGARFVLTLPQI